MTRVIVVLLCVLAFHGSEGRWNGGFQTVDDDYSQDATRDNNDRNMYESRSSRSREHSSHSGVSSGYRSGSGGSSYSGSGRGFRESGSGSGNNYGSERRRSSYSGSGSGRGSHYGSRHHQSTNNHRSRNYYSSGGGSSNYYHTSSGAGNFPYGRVSGSDNYYEGDHYGTDSGDENYYDSGYDYDDHYDFADPQCHDMYSHSIFDHSAFHDELCPNKRMEMMNGTCYLMSVFPTTFQRAKRFCSNLELKLVDIDTAGELSYVQFILSEKLAEENMTNGLNSMWIDVTNERGLWKSGENKTTLHFADWADGQPDPEATKRTERIEMTNNRIFAKRKTETARNTTKCAVLKWTREIPEVMWYSTDCCAPVARYFMCQLDMMHPMDADMYMSPIDDYYDYYGESHEQYNSYDDGEY